MKKQYLGILVAFLLVFSLGCSLGGLTEKAQEAKEQAEGLVEQAEELAEEAEGLTGGADNAEEPAPEAESELESEEESAAEEEIEIGSLEGLDSYRLTMEITFEMTDGSVERNVMEISATRNPDAYMFIMTNTGDSEEAGNMQMIRIGNQQWMQMGDEWMQTQVSEEDVSNFEEEMPFSADDMSGDMLDSGEYLGKEKINGINTRHYRIEELTDAMMGGAGLSEIENATQEVWIADESGFPAFVVRMKSEVESADMQGDGISKYTMFMEVSDVNADFTIEAPAEAMEGGLPEDIPVYPNATNQTVMMGMVTFEVEDDFEAVSDFYTTELEGAGWSKAEGGMAMEGMVMDTWTKEERSLQLTITADDDTGEVSVMLIVEDE